MLNYIQMNKSILLRIFLENEKNIREYVGVLNVRKAKLIESIEIKYDDVKDMIDERLYRKEN